MLGALEKDGNACISAVAFDYAYFSVGKSLEQEEFVTSIFTALKHTSEDDKIEFSPLIDSFRDLQMRQKSLKNETNEKNIAESFQHTVNSSRMSSGLSYDGRYDRRKELDC